MAPTPDEGSLLGDEHNIPDARDLDNSIVISGMSSLMPDCRTLEEFSEKLYNMEHLAAGEPRWKFNHPELTPYLGKVPDVQYFDAQFFGIHYGLSQSTDPMSKKLLEQTYQAIFDAGVSPVELSGKRVGVFVTTVLNDVRLFYSYSARGTSLLGCSKTMMANRISYWLNVRGPSYNLDASCSGSLVALEKACEAIKHGYCDAAIVGGARLALDPYYSVHMSRYIQQNIDAKMKCYDMNADGQTQAESVTVLFLQRYKDARRVYAEIYHMTSEYEEGLGDGFKHEYGSYRDPTKYSKFLRRFYEKAGVSPSSVEYVEGCGTAVPKADKAELEAMEQVFCKERRKPLLVGSVTSNIGFTDPTSGLSGVVKLLLAYHRGELAANLHCDDPRRDILALQDGRMRIVTRHEPFDRSFTALNNLSLTGVNVHLLLKGHYKNKDVTRYHCNIPYMVMASGRQESAVQKLLDNISGNKLDPEEIALYHTIHKKRIVKHMARGFGIYATQNESTVTFCEKVDYFDDARRPLWFVYSGMGSQWAGMGAQLMRIPIFAAAIERCDKVLKPQGLDIVDIITNPDVKMFDNILNSFVGIAAIQIGLTDVLRAVELVPDNIIGHSVGELGCAYADGCFTTEETILLAYSRGLISTQINFIRGSMAAVGMGYKQISKICPPEIDVACHNGPDSCTLSGPAEVMRKFVGELTSRGIFAKEVQCSNIAYHSRYIAEAGPKFLSYIKKLIKKPKLRSERWLSTSVQQERWHETLAKYSSAEYHTNNLLSPVLFEETSRLIPSNAVLVEVAPHGLLQAILKRSLSAGCHHVPLTRRGHPDNVLYLLQALGKLYMEGYDVDISALYPKIEFPVSTQTRQMSHLVEWVHTEEWNLNLIKNTNREYTGLYKPIVTLYEQEYTFLEGSIIEGTRIFPLAGALVFVWDTLSMLTHRPLRETSVQFHNVKCHKQLVLYDNRPLRLVIALQRGSGRFEMTHEDMLVVEGQIVTARTVIEVPRSEAEIGTVLNCKDIYKLLFERGYAYKKEFRSIHCSNASLTKAQLIWRNNWVTFIDGALQLCTLRHDHKGVSQPQYIKRICIDINTHLFSLGTAGNCMKDTLVDATVFSDQNTTKCGGLSVEYVVFKDKPLLHQATVLKTLRFMPFFQDTNGDNLIIFYMFMQIVAEYFGKEKVTTLNVDNTSAPSILNEIHSMLDGPPIKHIEVLEVKEYDIQKFKTDGDIHPDVIFLNRSTCNVDMLEALNHLYPHAFLLTAGVNVQDLYSSPLYIPVAAVGTGNSRLELARWKSKTLSAVALTVGRPEDLQCLVTSRTNLQPHQKLVVFTTYPPPSGLKTLVMQWRGEADRNQVYVAMVNDKYRVDTKQMPSFELPFNIFYQDTWGAEFCAPVNKDCKKDQVALRCAQLGDLNSLYWSQIPEDDHQRGNIKVQVHFAELNTYDAQRALGRSFTKHIQDHGFGMSFSGITESGKYVMGLLPKGSVATQIWSRPEFLWPVPTHWSLEDAATVPLAYTTAFYILGIRSRSLVPGKTLLIHGGTGALGQAAISIALAHKCQVFTTVSDHHKKTFLKNLFPDLPADHIANSRDVTFKDLILKATEGRGCDIVLSCVKGSLKNASLYCCGLGGSTYDVVQIHERDNFEFPMSTLMGAKSYITIDTSSIFSKDNMEDFNRIRLMLSEGISYGYVRPLSRVWYAPHEAARAFRLLAASKHRGRVLLRMQHDTLQVIPRLDISSNTCHVLLCDKEGFGLHFAARLVERGLKHLHLHVPSLSNLLLYKIQLWKKLGVDVKIATHAIDTVQSIEELLRTDSVMCLLEGIHVFATDLMDKQAKDGINTKIFYLDVVSRELCSGLRYFTVVSEDDSIGREVCLKRNQCNLKSLSIQMKLEKFTDTEAEENKNNLALMWPNAVQAIETAMLGSEAVVFVNLQRVQLSDILTKINQFPGVIITSSTDDTMTLRQVGVEQAQDKEVCNLLAEEFNIYITKDMVPCMTVGQIKKLKVPMMEVGKEGTCFDGFFSHIGSDEMLANADIILMPTLTHASNAVIIA